MGSHRPRRAAWSERVIGWDRHVDSIRQQQNIEAILKANEQHIDIAKALQAKVAQRLLTLEPNRLTPNDVARRAEIAVRIERMALGVSDGTTLEIRQAEPEPQQESLTARRIVEDPELRQVYLELLEKAHGRKPAHLRRVGDGDGQQSD
jgi:hypothetical protein